VSQKKNRHRETCMKEGLRIPSFSFLSRADGPSCRCPSLSVAFMHFLFLHCVLVCRNFTCADLISPVDQNILFAIYTAFSLSCFLAFYYKDFEVIAHLYKFVNV
jgi:hypothetical protein